MLVTVQEAPAEPGSKCLCMARRPRLKYHMDYCMEHPEELSRVAGLQKKVDEVKNVMVDNIEQVRPAILHGSLPAMQTKVPHHEARSDIIMPWHC